MDEVHLSQHFARSFRNYFDYLGNLVFNKLHRKIPWNFMTATCSKSIIAASECIFGFWISHKDWPTVKGMANWKQAPQATYTSVGIWYIYDVISQDLGKSDSDSNGHALSDKVMFYGNTQCNKIHKGEARI